MTPFSLPDVTFSLKTITKELFLGNCLCSTAVYSLSVNAIVHDYNFTPKLSFPLFLLFIWTKKCF